MMTNHLTELDLLNNAEIEELYLADNELTRIPDVICPHKVKIMSLRDNKISDLCELTKLKQMDQLYSISLFGNPFCDENDWEFIQMITKNITKCVKYVHLRNLDENDVEIVNYEKDFEELSN